MPANGALLSSIQKGTKLKKTVTNDRSAPKIGGSGGGSSSGGNGSGSDSTSNAYSTGTTGTAGTTGPPALGGLFAGGMPKLRSSSKNATGPLGAVDATTMTMTKTTKPIASTTLATKSPVVSAKSAEAPPPPPPPPPPTKPPPPATTKTKAVPPIPAKSLPLPPKPCAAAPLAKTFSRPEAPPPKPQSMKPAILKGTPPPVPDSRRKPSLSNSSASLMPPPTPPSRTRKQQQQQQPPPPPPPPPPKPSQSSITPAVALPKQPKQHVQTQFPIPKITAQKIQYPSGRSRATSFLPSKDLEPEEYLDIQVALLEAELRDASEIENYSVCLSLKSAITSLKAAATAAAASGEGSSCALTIKEIHKIIN